MASCVDPNHFTDIDGVIAPQPWMQLRQVARAVVLSRSGSYSPSGGTTKNDVLQAMTATWTNQSPVAQHVYGLVTRGGSRMALTARSRAVLVASHGFALGTAVPPLVEESTFGTGVDRGQTGWSNNAAFAVVEQRAGARATMLRPSSTEDIVVVPGGVVTARFQLAFRSISWESRPIDGGENGTESSYITGDTRLDLFAYPVI